MRVGVLGPLLVEIDDGPVSIPGRRQRDLLAALVLRRGTPVPPETLLDLVWRNENGMTATVVHTAVARLRRLCGAAAVERREAGYLVGRSTVTDADRFTDHLQSARRARRRDDVTTACDLYRRAIADWRGPEPFGGVTGHLVDADRARLFDLRMATQQELAELLLDHPEAGDPDEVGALAAAVMREEPLRERAHELAMLAAYRGGSQAAALAVYRDLRQTLRDELGVEPGPSISRLHSLILRQDPSLSPATAGAIRISDNDHRRAQIRPEAPARTREPRRPPVPLTPLIGRETALAGLIDAIDAGRKLITLVGPGGVGKTRLLLEIGVRYRDRRPIEYGELGAVTAADEAELAETVASSLGLEVSRRGAVRSLVAALADDPWLLLVDEAEVVADALGALAMSVLEGNPAAQVVVSSRRPLGVPGELVWPVEPLGIPTADADPWTAPAVQMLVQRLADRAVPVDRGGPSTTMLAEIAGRVDGLPLALELVAGQGSGRSLSELVDMVRSPLDVPAEASRRHRQRSLRMTFATSLDQLNPLQQRTFRRLGIFAGSFDRQSARAILTLDGETVADVETALPTLVRDALVQVDRRDPGRLHFRLLTVLRQLAMDAVPTAELGQLRFGHRRWFADRWSSERGSDELFHDVREHQEDYLQALADALVDDDGDAATEICLTLAEYWQLSGARLAGTKWLGSVLAAPALPARGRARLQVRRAALLQNHDPAVVLADTTDAITVLDPSEDTESVVSAYRVRAVERWLSGHPAAAAADADLAVQIAARWDPQLLAQALSTQALTHAVIGDRATALAAAERAMELLPELPWASRRLTAALELSLALVNLGCFSDALGILDAAALDLPQTTGRDTPAPSRFAVNLGWAALGAGELGRARENFVHSLRRGGPVAADPESAEVLLGLGCVLAAQAGSVAAPLLAGARELMQRLAVPMSLEWKAAIDRAERAAGGISVVAVGAADGADTESDAALTRRLGRIVDDLLNRS